MGRHADHADGADGADRAADDAPAWADGLVDALDGSGLRLDWVLELADRALREDLGGSGAGWAADGAVVGHDVTTEATVPADADGEAHLVARAGGVLAGSACLLAVVALAARHLDLPAPTVELHRADGDEVAAGDAVAVLRGRVRVLLLAERTALNLLSRASGVATATRAWVRAVEGTGATVLDTRKTTPGLRALEKHAVRCGGGANKRLGLSDVAMVKDNHVAAAGSVEAAYAAVREAFPGVAVQVEVESAEQAVAAVRAGARFLLADNVEPAALRELVGAARAAAGEERVEVEATGGLSLERAREYAETGVDHLSVGALTHSAPALDLALDLQAPAAVS